MRPEFKLTICDNTVTCRCRPCESPPVSPGMSIMRARFPIAAKGIVTRRAPRRAVWPCGSGFARGATTGAALVRVLAPGLHLPLSLSAGTGTGECAQARLLSPCAASRELTQTRLYADLCPLLQSSPRLRTPSGHRGAQFSRHAPGPGRTRPFHRRDFSVRRARRPSSRRAGRHLAPRSSPHNLLRGAGAKSLPVPRVYFRRTAGAGETGGNAAEAQVANGRAAVGPADAITHGLWIAPWRGRGSSDSETAELYRAQPLDRPR
ncbi:hypothetical protein C2E23DRAFT_539882 [Lenzites betulinus]|nr:hypothetical protein C2E23DRAFT_539882 [Lenzites betulinus]